MCLPNNVGHPAGQCHTELNVVGIYGAIVRCLPTYQPTPFVQWSMRSLGKLHGFFELGDHMAGMTHSVDTSCSIRTTAVFSGYSVLCHDTLSVISQPGIEPWTLCTC